MGCNGCGSIAKMVKYIKKKGNDAINILAGKKVSKSVWESRMHICKNCGWFNALNWTCRMANSDSRQLCWSGKCPQKSWV